MKFTLGKKNCEVFSPYIIAEIGVNHEGKVELAKKMILDAAEAGAHGAKFQTYKAEKIASEAHSKSYWDLNEESSTSQFQLFKKYDLFGEDEYKELAEYCKEQGIDFLSTPFDLDAVDMLDPLVPFFKIASADITNVPLLRKVASKGKPVVVSTGASTLGEIETALSILEKAGAEQIALLHCVLNYPTPEENAQIAGIERLKRIFGNEYAIGYSDHVKPNSNGRMPAIVLAATMGSLIIEKHYTFDKGLPGNDHYHAMDEKDLAAYTQELKQLKNLYGTENKNLEKEESARVNARRRICVKKSLKAGTVLTEEDLIALRADRGIEISQWDSILGKKLTDDLSTTAPLEWENLKK